MKKILLGSIVFVILMVPTTGALNILSINNAEIETPSNISNEDFTHTVLVESCTKTTCPYCVTAASQLYSIYNSGDLDFHYVALVTNEGNLNVRLRLQELGITVIPDVFFDGKYNRITGGQSSEQPYRDAITQAGMRDVPDIDLDVEVVWRGGSTLKIEVTVVNNEPETYKGHLRTYIVEKESRWNDQGGNPYHYAVLDIPIDRSLAIVANSGTKPLGDTYTFKKTWFGVLHGFGDISRDNIKVTAAVFDTDTDYAVQTASAEPTSASNSHQTTNPLFLQILEGFINRFPLLERLLGF